MGNLFNDRQFWLDSLWRSLRTVCQTLAGLLAGAQTSKVIEGMTISIPWYMFLYVSGVAGLISLLQSIDRERAVGEVVSSIPVTPPELPAPVSALTPGPGCGGDQR